MKIMLGLLQQDCTQQYILYCCEVKKKVRVVVLVVQLQYITLVRNAIIRHMKERPASPDSSPTPFQQPNTAVASNLNIQILLVSLY